MEADSGYVGSLNGIMEQLVLRSGLIKFVIPQMRT